MNKQEAISTFDSYPWTDELDLVAEIESAGRDCVNPEISFRIDDRHLSIQVCSDGVLFDIEASIRIPKRLFGIFARSKFYNLAGRSKDQCKEDIQAIFSQSPEIQHGHFSRAELSVT